ncbi:LacI family DNA-binding transcriptional regulator [Paraflavisolibacter sp. H34]|uniref:LacI family DNA-binding transcriptional regulator n=1 Tax=Huijunlia imazamoxiresistens TaxID=3127457 RepID=UPI003019DC26
MQEKEITISDIAAQLGLSEATVSRALADHPRISKKTKKRITDLADALGYRPNRFARSLREQRTHTIGVVVPRLNSHFMSAVIAGMEDMAQRKGYNLLISQSSENPELERQSLRTMYNSRVDGLLVSVVYKTESTDHFDLFFKKNIPVIFFDRTVEGHKGLSVVIDNRKAAYEATCHLIQQGCRELVHITADSPVNVYRERTEGFQQALADHHLAVDAQQVLLTDLSFEAGERAAAALLERPRRPDGVFVANDSCAAGCIVALKKKGLSIPGDMAFVGFNNDIVARVLEPNLTTINYPGYEMGAAAVTQLILLLEGASTLQMTDRVTLRSDLVIRDSSRRPKAQE